jgi:hypothetical protein
MAAILTAVDMVSQNGPSIEPRYFSLMSSQPSASARRQSLAPSATSVQAEYWRRRPATSAATTSVDVGRRGRSLSGIMSIAPGRYSICPRAATAGSMAA